MRVILLIIAICSCFGHPCFRAMKSYVAECEIPNTVDSDYCKNKRQEVINGGCEQIVKDFDICKGDLKKLCSPDNENPRGCFGRCLVNKIPQLSSECANTETVKRIIERVKSGRFPGAPENGNGNDSPQAPNGEQPPPPPPNGDLPPPPPNGEQPPPPPNGELPQQPPNGELPRPTLDGELPPPAKGDEPSIEVRTGSSEQEIRHSEYQLKGGMRHRGWNRFHKRCGWKTKFVMFVVVSLLFTIGLCWTIRERQRRAFLRRSRVTTPKLPGSWSTGLFGSWDQITPDWKTCLPSFLFPCFQNALNQSELQDRDCTFADFFFNICHWQRHSNTYRDRQEIRARHNIPEDSCGDCLASVFCSPCAIAQNAREIDIRTCAQGGTYWPAQKLPDTWVPAKTDII